jgi:hypothetical protein
MTTQVLGTYTFLESPTVNGVPIMLNNGSTPAIASGTFASMPAAGNLGTLYVTTDTLKIYRDNGTIWQQVVGSVPTTLATCTDVTLVGMPASGQFLQSNGTSWVNAFLTSYAVTTALGFIPLGSAGGALSNPLTVPAGSTTNPSIGFNGTQTGFYEIASNILGFTAGGTGVGYISSTGLNNMAIGNSVPSTGNFTYLTTNYTVNAGAGSTTAPAFGFNGTQTGLYEVSPNILGFTAGGTSVGYVSSTGLNNIAIGASVPSTGTFSYLNAQYNMGIGAGSSNNPSLFFNTTNTGLYEVSPTMMGYTMGGTAIGYMSNTGINNMAIGASVPSTGDFTTISATTSVSIPAGSAGSPSIYFSNTQTGLYEVSASILGFTAGGNAIGYMTATGLNNMAIGTQNPSSGVFSTLSVTGSASFASISNTPIGSSGVSTGAFSILGATTINLSATPTLTAASTGKIECDTTNLYGTIDTTSGRGIIPIEQYFHLTAIGSTIGTMAANYFGNTSNPSLVANGIYEIDIVLYYLKTTSGSVTWSLINSTPISQNIHYKMSPTSGIVTPPGSTTTLEGDVYNNTAATYSLTTGNLSSGVNHVARFKIWLENNVGSSLKIQASCSAGIITPGIGSTWTCKRRPSGNIGTFSA